MQKGKGENLNNFFSFFMTNISIQDFGISLSRRLDATWLKMCCDLTAQFLATLSANAKIFTYWLDWYPAGEPEPENMPWEGRNVKKQNKKNIYIYAPLPYPSSSCAWIIFSDCFIPLFSKTNNIQKYFKIEKKIIFILRKNAFVLMFLVLE